MLDRNSLKAEMVRKGMTQNDIAKALGISTKTLSSRFKKGWFGSDEIEKISALLKLENPWSIFFA